MNVKNGCSYRNGRPWVQKERTNTYKYPIIMNVKNNEELSFWWSSRNDLGEFGQPKIVFSKLSKNIYLDLKGEYGICATFYSFGEPEELVLIKEAMLTPRFLEITKRMNVTGLLGGVYNFTLLSHLKPDFYKEFL